jgi:hypothetical protein
MYRGEVFHIQTEDSGLNNPHIITLLYRGGTIISSKKTSYADIIKIENLDQVVEELMKEQHKEMLRGLKSGLYDERAFGPRAASPAVEVAPEQTKPAVAPPADLPATRQPPREISKQSQSLDEIILDYLVRGEDT